MEKRTKDIFGPPLGIMIFKSYFCWLSLLLLLFIIVGKKLIIFIDDMNMPQVDTYGTQQPIALLKLLLEKGGMYDRGKDLNWKVFKDIFILSAMGKVQWLQNTLL